MHHQRHDVLAAVPGTCRQIHSFHYGPAPEHGKIYIQASLHADELPGMLVIWHLKQRMLELEQAGLLRKHIVLVPVANPLAFAQATREGQRNLNRRFLPQPDPQDYEDRITHQLAPLLAQHEVLLDLHSFHTPGDPFAMVGPRNNSGAREPFARAAEEMALARALGAQQVVEGWLEVYDRAAGLRGELPDDEGIGTNEYMRSQGGYAVTIECGQHEDPEAIDVATRAIHGALAHLELAHVPAPPRFAGPAARLKDVVLRESPADRLAQDWHSFDAVQAGDVIAHRADGTPVAAPYDGCVLFPHPEAEVGQELFYLAEPDAG